MQFTRLGNAIMVRIHPEAQLRIDRIFGIDHAIAIHVVLRQRKKTIWMSGSGLWCEVAEQLCFAIDYAVGVVVEHQKGIIRIRGPCNLNGDTCIGNVKFHAIGGTG